MTRRQRITWACWGLCSLIAGGALAQHLLAGSSSRQLFLPGKTTDGHYQIELECAACHKTRFTSPDELQAACVSCHGGELATAKDSHPTAKFTDPRNAARVAILDGRYCVTCHAEHRPERTHGMGLSLPVDYCYQCHQDIGSERASHAGLSWDSCANVGCHNFHDNRALYEDYLLQHAGEPWLLATPVVPALPVVPSGPSAAAPTPRLTLAEADAPSLPGPEGEAWEASAHAAAGVNCSGCHRSGEGASLAVEVCGSCHAAATAGWRSGRHGMRVEAGLAPMRVGDARLPMKAAAGDERLDCASCHGAHETEMKRAALEACEHCHDDRHTKAYRKSKHFALLLQERDGRVATGSGVTCASCHLPRAEDDSGQPATQHNQNDNLRPSEKMARSVCHSCHGLEFTLDALADAELVQENFSRAPSAHVASMDFAKNRAK